MNTFPRTHTQDVTKFTSLDGHTLTLSEQLRLLGASESQSEHPIGKVIHSYAQERLAQAAADEGVPLQEAPECTDYEALPGLGLACRADGKFVWVGNVPLMNHIGVTVSADVREALKWHGDRAETAVILAGAWCPVCHFLSTLLRCVLLLCTLPLSAYGEASLFKL